MTRVTVSDSVWSAPLRLVTAGLLIAAVALMASTPAAGQSNDPDAAIDLTAVSNSVAMGDEFSVDFRILGPTDQRSIEIAIHDPMSTRNQLHVELATGPTGDVRTIIGPFPLDTLTLSNDSYRWTLDTSDAGFELQAGSMYPVQIALRSGAGDDSRLEDHIVLYVVIEPTTVQSGLAVGMVVPFSAPPMLQADGTSAIDSGDRNQLEAAAAALTATTGIALSIDATPETLIGLLQSGDDRDRDLVQEILLTLEQRETLATPFVRLDVEAWIRTGDASDVAEQVSVGSAALTAAIEAPPTAGTWLVRTPVGAETLTGLVGLGLADRVVVPSASVVAIQSEILPVSDGQRFEVVDGNGVGHDAIVADAALQTHFDRSRNTILNSHHLLADLGLIALAAPDLARGVVVVPPPDWITDADLLVEVLNGIATNPLLLPMTVTDVFSHASALTLASDPDGQILRRELVEPVGASVVPLAAQRAAAQNAVVSRQDLVPGTSQSELLQRLLLISASSDLSESGQLAYLDTIVERVDADASAITTTNPDRITLSARSGPVPISLRNDAVYAIQVLLTVSSDKLEFPEGATRELVLAPGVTDVVMPVEARTSGDATLDLLVTSPDRGIELHRSRVIVRSTALSGVGLVIAAIALVNLLVWWLRNLRSNQRNERLMPTADHTPDPEYAEYAEADSET